MKNTKQLLTYAVAIFATAIQLIAGCYTTITQICASATLFGNCRVSGVPVSCLGTSTSSYTIMGNAGSGAAGMITPDLGLPNATCVRTCSVSCFFGPSVLSESVVVSQTGAKGTACTG